MTLPPFRQACVSACRSLFQQSGDFVGVWAAKAGAGVPAPTGGVSSVIAARYVVQGGRRRIELRIDKTDRASFGRIDTRDKAGPERRHRAGSADDGICPIDPDIVSGLWVGIAADVRHAAHGQRLGATRCGCDAQPILPGRQRESGTDAAAARATLRPVVPDRLELIVVPEPRGWYRRRQGRAGSRPGSRRDCRHRWRHRWSRCRRRQRRP